MESELLHTFQTVTDGRSIYLGKNISDRWHLFYVVNDYNTYFENYMPLPFNTYSVIKKLEILRESKEYKKCLNCGHDVFIKRYSSYNKKLKLSETGGEMMLFRVEDFGDVDCIICEKCNEKF